MQQPKETFIVGNLKLEPHYARHLQQAVVRALLGVYIIVSFAIEGDSNLMIITRTAVVAHVNLDLPPL